MAKTFFIDIDGTLVRHLYNDEISAGANEQLLPKVAEFMQEVYNQGHYIILTTARMLEHREQTEEMLENFGIRYHDIIFDIGSEERILINDIKPVDAYDGGNRYQSRPTAYAINVQRNKGFEDILTYDFTDKVDNLKQCLRHIIT